MGGIDFAVRRMMPVLARFALFKLGLKKVLGLISVNEFWQRLDAVSVMHRINAL